MLFSLIKTEALLLLTLSTFTSARSLAPSSNDEVTPITTTEAQDGFLFTHLIADCSGHSWGKPKPPIRVPVDRCLSTNRAAIVIKEPAICANGTRAKWARYTDTNCGNGTVDHELGLMDLADADIGKCLSLWDAGIPDEKDEKKTAHAHSAGFWCDGVKPRAAGDDKKKEPVKDEPKGKKGSFSESVCAGKAPFFSHAETDFCVTTRTEKMKIFDAGICVNGTQSTLARYKDRGCRGVPSFQEVTEDLKKTCLDMKETPSFAFFCTGEGIQDSVPGGPRQGNSSPLHFLMVVFIILLMFILMLVLSVFAWVRRYGNTVGGLIELIQRVFKPKDKGIAL